MPDQVDTYWEPFVGGGSLFFAIADRIRQAHLSDVNEELIIAYQVVRDKVDALIDALKGHEKRHHDKIGYYLEVRESEPEDEVQIAARLIYLNKTSRNGIYRLDAQGKFNVPEGASTAVNNFYICDAEG